MVLLHEPLEPFGLLEIVKVPPLQIFNERQKTRILIVDVHKQARHLAETRKTRRAQSPLACNELKKARLFPDSQGLQNAVLPDGRGQLLQALCVKDCAAAARGWGGWTTAAERRLFRRNAPDRAFVCVSMARLLLVSSYILRKQSRENARKKDLTQGIVAVGQCGTKCGEPCG